MFNIGSLRNKIIAWSFVPAAIILATVALVAYNAYQRVTTEMVIQRNQEVVRLAASQVAGELSEYSDDLATLARSLSVHVGNPVALRRALASAANSAAIFDAGVVLMDDHGVVEAAQPPRQEIIGEDWSDRLYFQQLLRSGGPVMTDVLPHGPNDEDVIVIGVPITGDRGEFLGAAAGMFRIGPDVSNSFYGSIVKLRLAPSEIVYMVDSAGRALYHSDDVRIGVDLSRQDPVRMVTLRKTGAERDANLDGEQIVAAYSPVPGSPWGLVMESDWHTLVAPNREYSRFLLILLGLGLLIPAIVSAIGSTRITQPIRDLAIAAQLVAGGNFGHTVQAETGDEVEELVTQFNRMSAELLNSYTTLKEREERLGLVIEGTNDGIWDWEIGPNRVYFSPRWKAMLGYADDELVNEFSTWGGLIHPDDRARVQLTLQDYLDGRSPAYVVEHRLRHKDGGYRWILARGTVLRDADGKPYRMAGSHTDINQLKRAEGILAGQREFLELLVTGQNFCDTLDALIRSIEEQTDGLYGMVRLIDNRSNLPACASAPSLPDEFIEAVDASGSGGTPDLPQYESILTREDRRVVVTDIEQAPRWAHLRDVARKYGIRACWAEPIPAPDGRVIGAFVLYSERSRAPDPAEVRVMETAARLVGIAREQEESQHAIQRAYQTLERRVAERTRELATLNAVAAVANQSLELEQILESALDETMDALRMEAGAAYWLDDRDQSLRATVTRGLSDNLARKVEALPLETALAGRPVALDEPYSFTVEDYPRGALRDLIQTEGLRLIAGVPLVASGQLVGFLVLTTRNERSLTSDERRLLMSVGQQVGVGVENANLYSAEQRRRQVAEGLRETLTVLNSRQSLSETLEHIVQQAQRLMGSDAVALMRLQPAVAGQERAGPLVVQASVGLPESFAGALRVPIGGAASGRAIAERCPVAVADTAVMYQRLVREGGLPEGMPDDVLAHAIATFHALLAVPLIIRDEPYGAISLYYTQVREFTDEDLRLAAAVADQAALAIESARLRDQAGITAAIEERTRLARELHDSVTQSLFSVTLYAEAAARLLESGNGSSAADYLREVRDTAQEALREMRLLIFQLRPPKLEEVGLAGALQARLQGVESRGGIDADLRVTGEQFATRTPLPVQADLYAIVQEALNNCLKHAQASHVWVELEFRADGTCVSVRDDGVGFDLAEGAETGGMGLQTMQERAERIGGALTIERIPAGGTAVKVELRARKE
jgi:PAS domain S-box-containing protein